MNFTVDPGSSVSLAEQLAVQVRAALAAGELVAGERLPPARELATALKINMHTVLRAYQQLRDEGILELRQGRGAVVRADASDASVRLNQLATQLAAEAKKHGLSRDELHARIDQLMKETS